MVEFCKRFNFHVKDDFENSVVADKSDRLACSIIAAASVWKLQCHVGGSYVDYRIKFAMTKTWFQELVAIKNGGRTLNRLLEHAVELQSKFIRQEYSSTIKKPRNNHFMRLDNPQ